MYQIRFCDSIAKIPANIWDSLCHTDYPFIQHAFLLALEESGSVCAATGWQPMHLQLLDEDQQLIGVMPLYLKNHSYGEYVFDWSWADAWERHGLNYYPKLVTAIPYTPAQGPRFGCRLPDNQACQFFYAGIRQLSQQVEASSWHGLFVPESLRLHFSAQHCATRMGLQYHWFNRGYTSFDDYLGHFSSRKRKNLRKERQKIQDQGIAHHWISGLEVSDKEMEHFWRFYQMTHLKRGRRGYLTRAFFEQLRHSLAEQMLFCFARRDGQTLAGALFFRDQTTLYGRYWGSVDAFDSLHFETCYYQGIDYAIAAGLERFDPGAQGEHKIARGFEPVPTWSVHHIEHPEFSHAVRDFVTEEAAQLQQIQQQLRKSLPFRRHDDSA
ncbi:hypothetical protein ADINL_0349 [Nitrincola lacisaponensis]|uniref:COGs COG3146 n=1 Tax=Nitrincola lacisaponensis TaxID=267850 RepID=A0A063Y964_9GAMM|nr:GNAT family N-acetyltransferase [Nitrincola lacisaponensis]KDE41276.1 hypothetical protein ADINL_0349 [Nitrincola lacisaponensis]